jgi:hypothetical protein
VAAVSWFDSCDLLVFLGTDIYLSESDVLTLYSLENET